MALYDMWPLYLEFFLISIMLLGLIRIIQGLYSFCVSELSFIVWECQSVLFCVLKYVSLVITFQILFRYAHVSLGTNHL